MRPENTTAKKVLKPVLKTVLVALAGLSLSACAMIKPLHLDESTNKIVADLQQLSKAIEDFTAQKGRLPVRSSDTGTFRKDMLTAGVLSQMPTPPPKAKRKDFNPEYYKYEYFPRFDELGGPTAEGDDAALWLAGISAHVCRHINLTYTQIGDRIPNHEEEGYISDVPFYCADHGGTAGYSILKYETLR